MRKVDIKRKLTVPEDVFNDNWDTIFGNKEIEPIPFAGMVDTSEYMDVSYHKDGEVITGKEKK